jgi:hypothetical protein
MGISLNKDVYGLKKEIYDINISKIKKLIQINKSYDAVMDFVKGE